MPISENFILSGLSPLCEPKKGSLTDFVFADFDAFPADKTAVVDDASGRRYTFADLKRITGQVASGLAKRGFGKGHVLSIFGRNVLENAPIAHGALVTGGTVQLMKPMASQEELRFHFGLVTPKIIVTTANCAEGVLEAVKAAAPDVQDIFVIGGSVDGCRRAEELLEDPGDANPWGRVDIDSREDVALLMQTGGTTGMSKTVMVTHEMMKLAITEIIELEPRAPRGDMSLGYIPFNHAFSFVLLYSAWLRQGCGVVNLGTYDIESILRTVEKHKVTRMAITPVALTALVNCPHFAKADLSSVLQFCCAGAALSKNMAERLSKSISEKAPNATLQQAYGMTEIVGAITNGYPRQSDIHFKDRHGSVGLLQSDMKLQVISCDEPRRPCKPGESGEILLRSPRMTKGYLKNEEATHKAIVDGWFHTGDFGYFDEDGYVYVVDRVDDLIRHKDGVIVPTHVEGILRSHPAIGDCAVVGHVSKESGGEVAMAFVVKKDGCDVTEEEVQRFAAENLAPREQLTGGVRFVSVIPKSPAGKMLRRVLTKEM